jgi:putative chitinase
MIEQAPGFYAGFGFTPVAWAEMMGEFTEECAGTRDVEEDIDYRASVLRTHWPQHFSMVQAIELQHQPISIANQAYNGRIGNRWDSNDCWNYRGRGPAQTTGRDAYGLLGEKMKIDLIGHPEPINTPQHFLCAGAIDFVLICGCLPYAKRDDEVNETRHLNGGLIGLPQRKASIRILTKSCSMLIRIGVGCPWMVLIGVGFN